MIKIIGIWRKYVFFLFFFVLLLDPLVAAKKVKKSSKEDNIRKKEVYIFPVLVNNRKDKIFFEKLNNQVYSCFSNIKGLQAKFAIDINLKKRFLNNLFANLQMMVSYKIIVNKNFKYVGISLEKQKDLSDRYAIIIPTVKEYKLTKSILSVVTNLGQPNIVKTNYIYKLNFNVSVRVMSPVMEQNFAFTNITREMSGPNKYELWFKAVNFIGKRLAIMAENHYIFDTDTKINYVNGNNVFFLNKNKINPEVGDEFSYYQSKRYPDGYVDEIYRGIFKIKKKVGHLWQGRAISGRLPSVHDNIHFGSHKGFSMEFFMRGYMIDFPDDIFSSSSGITWNNNDYQLIQGAGVRLGFELGFRSKLFIEGLYFLDTGIDILQANLGFSFDFLATRNFFFQYALSGLIRYFSCNFGFVSDGSADEGKKVRAYTFNPGAEMSLSMNFLLFRASVLLKFEIGYNYVLPLKGDDWNFSVDGSSSEYEPDNVKKVFLGGPFASASLGFRF